jgi:EmrB/QacA subfamily drug resistance transporter
MNVLDQTIVNVALPTIQRGLGFTQANLAWVIDAYLITFGGLLLLAGRLGDLIGRKKTFLAGVTLFTVSSAFCGFATSQGMLIGARFAQGTGAAFSASVVLAIIVAEFPDPGERTKAMNAYILVSIGGGSLGLILGGVLTQALSWHWIFFINLPIGLVTLAAGALLLEDDEGLGIHAGLDVGGAVLSTGGLMLAIYAIVTSTGYGWHSAHTLGFAAAALAVLAAFAVLETRLTTPMMPLRVLRSRGLASTSLVRGLMVFGLYGTFFLGALTLQKAHGFDAIHTGFGFLPQTTTVAATTLGLTALLIRHLRPKLAAFFGICVLIVGLGLLASAGPNTAYFPTFFFGMLLSGLGGATAFTPLLTIGLAEIAPADAGLGSGIINVTQQVSAAVAVAILGVVSSNRTTSLLASHHSMVHALVGGYRLAFTVSVGMVAVSGIVCLLLLRNVPAPQPAVAVPEAVEA